MPPVAPSSGSLRAPSIGNRPVASRSSGGVLTNIQAEPWLASIVGVGHHGRQRALATVNKSVEPPAGRRRCDLSHRRHPVPGRPRPGNRDETVAHPGARGSQLNAADATTAYLEYDGAVHAIDAVTGQERWVAAGSKTWWSPRRPSRWPPGARHRDCPGLRVDVDGSLGTKVLAPHTWCSVPELEVEVHDDGIAGHPGDAGIPDFRGLSLRAQ